MDPVDRAILDAIAQGNKNLASSLILHHFSPTILARVRVIAGAADADDVLLETVLAVITAVDEKRFAGTASLLTYATKTAIHIACRVRRSRWQRLFHGAADPGEEDDLPAPSDPAPPWGDADERELVGRLLARLVERERLVITLRLAGTSFSSIGRTLAISEEAAWQLYNRALGHLRAFCDENERDLGILVREEAREGPRPTPAARRSRRR